MDVTCRVGRHAKLKDLISASLTTVAVLSDQSAERRATPGVPGADAGPCNFVLLAR
jgi:hypothetical protein